MEDVATLLDRFDMSEYTDGFLAEGFDAWDVVRDSFIIYDTLMAQRRILKSNAHWVRAHLGGMQGMQMSQVYYFGLSFASLFHNLEYYKNICTLVISMNIILLLFVRRYSRIGCPKAELKRI